MSEETTTPRPIIFVVQDSGEFHYACRGEAGCGAVVVDRERHWSWHGLPLDAETEPWLEPWEREKAAVMARLDAERRRRHEEHEPVEPVIWSGQPTCPTCRLPLAELA